MKIEKVVLENFRQYKGRHELVFSTYKNKNVTVVHAENGVGKTALLNALLWGFFGHDGLTEDFEDKEKIINEHVAASSDNPEKSNCSIKIIFSHEEDSGIHRYTLVRSLSLAQQRADSKRTQLVLEVQTDGETHSIERPQWKIEAMLPEGISPFLFFNGERIEQLSRTTNAAKITEAIHQILGLNILQNTINDLENRVSAILNGELKEYADSDTARLIEEQQKIIGDIEKKKEEIQICLGNQTAIEEQSNAIVAKLQANQKTRELQEKRNELERIKAEKHKSLKELKAQVSQIVSQDAYALFAEDSVKRGKEIASRLRSEGKIPARVLNGFLDELLNIQKCICTRPLSPGSIEYDAVNKLRTISGEQDFNNAVAALDNAIGSIEGVLAQTRASVEDAINRIYRTNREIVDIDQSLAEIHELLGSKEDEEVTELERSLEKARLKKSELLMQHGVLQHELLEANEKLEAKRREIASRQQEAESAKICQRRIKALDDTSDVLKKILDFEMKDIRTILNEEIGKHFGEVIFKDFWAELTDDFVLHIRKKLTGGTGDTIDVAKSMGENQITSLVFIGSLLSLAKRRDQIPTILKGLQGGEYPICMDSPFGQMGPIYRLRIAQLLPRIAPQVIVFVSPSQWRGEVEDYLKDRVGAHYLLVYHGPKPMGDANKSIIVLGKRYTQYQESAIEYTLVKELEV